MVMRRAGSASPEAIMAERTRSRASDTALSGRPTMVKAGHAWCDLHLDIDGPNLDAFERDRGDPLDHACPCLPGRVAEGARGRKNI